MKFELLNVDSNAKTIKGQSRGYMTAVLYLAPSDSSGTQLCPVASLAGCVAGCLNTAGRGGMSAGNAQFTTESGAVLPDNAVQRARLRRTQMFLSYQDGFMATLTREIHAFALKAKRAGLVPVVRLNGTSDIRWEDIPVNRVTWLSRNVRIEMPAAENIFARFHWLQFYDYTKIPNRRRAMGLANYHLTFSYSHAPAYAPIAVKALQTYGDKVNYAAVFAGKQPETFLGRTVVNGDESDLRFADPVGVVVALTAKGRARKDFGGFVVR